MRKPSILIIEDTASMAALYKNYLQIAHYEADITGTGAAGINALAQKTYQAVVLDLHLPDIHGLEILKHIKTYYDDLPVIVVTAYGSIAVAVDSMRYGAFDFIMKPFPASRLNATMQNALENGTLKRELKDLRRSVCQSNFGGFIGNSPTMQALYRQIESVASSKACVFISGESGTGKELVAETLHRASPRAPRNCITVNCATTSKDRLEAEIFGYVKGAFPHAEENRSGAAHLADGGTLFLDEICDMPLDLQGKILRFVQSGSFTPVGSSAVERVDVRFIASTNRDAQAEVEAGRLREDLFYRLHVVPIEVPALRDREDDVVLLAETFLKRANDEAKKNFARFEPDVLSFLRQYEWPGNVRQLQNLVQQLVIMNKGDVITMAMLPDTLRSTARPRPHVAVGFEPFIVKPLWQIEKENILKALKATANDVPRASAMLEISPSTIYRKLQAWRMLDTQNISDSRLQVVHA